MPTFYFSYSTVHGIDAPEPPNSPYTISWHLGRYLRERVTARGYEFKYVNLDDLSRPTITADDVVLGHTLYPDGFVNYALDSAAKAKFIIQPYQPAMVGEGEVEWIKALFAKADHLFLVTGPAWWNRMQDTPYAEWKARATRLDMAVNPALHPLSKKRWNPQGKRRFLCIGADMHVKGLDLIAELAHVGGFYLGYYGNCDYARFQHVPQFVHHGGREFTPDVTAWAANEYDAFISLARSDANPTTLLETALWGMLPMCNKESGYEADDPFLELRLGDMLHNLAMIDYVQNAPEYVLRQRAAAIRERVVCEHGWDEFCLTVWSEVERWL